MRSNFCAAPWTEVYIGYTSIGPCCVNFLEYKTDSVQEYLESDYLVNLKKDFLTDSRPSSCRACWETEAAGLASVRQRNTTRGKWLQRIGLKISNHCNFKCRMCSSADSSAWVKDTEASKLHEGWLPTGDIIHRNNFKNIDWIIEQCKNSQITLTILGGEPFISEEFIYLLEKIDEHDLYDNIYLIVTSNMSTTSYKGVDYRKALSKFKNIEIYASFDGCFSVGSYIRHGMNFEKFTKNVIHFKPLVKNLSTTVQIYNIYNMPQIFKFAEKLNLQVVFCFLTDPEFLRVDVIDNEEKQNIKKYYESKNFYNSELNTLLNNKNDLTYLQEHFKAYTSKLDQLWGTDIHTSIPELSPFLHKI